MLPGIVPVTIGRKNLSWAAAIAAQGLATSLVLCLDAGDANSYPGTGQQWTDTSPQAVNYNLGATSSSEASDPTFNGTGGRLTGGEYFSCDGGDFFSPVATTTIDDAWHKDGATVTVATAIWIPSTPSNTYRTIIGNYNSAQNAVSLTIIDTNNLSWRVEGGSTTNFAWGSITAIQNAWAIVIVSVNENGGAGASHWNVNGAITAFNGSYTSPSAANSAGNLQIGRDATGSSIVPNTFRYSAIAAWNRTLSQAETAKLFQEMRWRYGL